MLRKLLFYHLGSRITFFLGYLVRKGIICLWLIFLLLFTLVCFFCRLIRILCLWIMGSLSLGCGKCSRLRTCRRQESNTSFVGFLWSRELRILVSRTWRTDREGHRSVLPNRNRRWQGRRYQGLRDFGAEHYVLGFQISVHYFFLIHDLDAS